MQIRQRLLLEVKKLREMDGASLQDLMTAFSIERSTAQRDMQLLKKDGLVGYAGSKKTGKYTLTPQGLKLFE
jgi:DNA-binding IclR family transcriptional regulator